MTPAAHYIILRGVVKVYANDVCNVDLVGPTVALDRTVEYEEKRNSQYTAPDKKLMLLFRVNIIVVASSIAALGRLKKKEENPIFNPC